MGRILVIEDDPGNQLLYRSRLKDLGHEVVVSGNGAQGIAEARTGAYDLYLVDMHLGEGVDGIEICSRLKRDPETRNVPVVLISTKIRSRADLHRGYEAGCEAFLVKNDATLVEDVVRAMLRIKSLQDELASQMTLLRQRNERLQQAQSDKAALEDRLKNAGAGCGGPSSPTLCLPDGMLLVDAEGAVVSTDRGAQELFSKRLEGKSLGSLAPGTRFEAFVRDVRQVSHNGFRFTLPARGSRLAKQVTVSVYPLVPTADRAAGEVPRVVLLWDVDRHAAGDVPATTAPGTTLPELAVLGEIARREFTPERILGDSVEAAELRRLAGELSRSLAPVVLTGEGGVGKSFFARTLHFAGNRQGSFVPVGCADLARDQLEAAILGGGDDPGLLARAAGGTLLLRDFEQIPMATQKRIVELLRDGIEKGRKRHPVDVRVVLSTTRPLDAIENDGLLELEGCRTVGIPPLRQRVRDVRPIAQALCFELTGGRVEITENAWIALEGYEWPGNTRELGNVLTQALGAVGQSASLDLQHLPAPLPDVFERSTSRGHVTPSQAPAGHVAGTHKAGPVETAPASGVEEMLEELLAALPEPEEDEERIPVSFDFFEKWALKFALAQTQGDKLKAAKLLQVGKSTLYRKLHKFEI